MRRLLLLALSSAGCLCAQFQFNYVQGTYSAPITVPQYSFGTASVGDIRNVQFSVANISAATATLTTLTVTAPFSILNGPSLPQAIPAGAAINFTVSFAPTQAGSFSSTLAADGVSLVIVGTANSAVAIAVGDGSSEPAPLEPGGSIDFGSLAQGSTTSLQVTMTNLTQATLTIQNIAVVNTQGTSFQMQPVSLPISLQPGVSATLEVDFTPSGSGPQQGALEIDQRSIPLTGIGFAPAFPQPIILVSISSAASSEQGTLTLSLPSPSPASGTGQVEMAFNPASPNANADSGIVFLLNGSQSVPFTVNQGDTAGQFGTAGSVGFQTGTTAGTIVFTVTLGDFTGTYSLTIPAAPASIDNSTAQYTSGGLDLEIAGFDNTRTASTLTLTFFDAEGATLNGGPVTVDGTADFQQFYATSDDGGMFALHAFFPVTAGNPAAVAAVEFQMTNSAGASSPTKIYFTKP